MHKGKSRSFYQFALNHFEIVLESSKTQSQYFIKNIYIILESKAFSLNLDSVIYLYFN